jgi:LytS/YehU family sensor histidine kinase
MVLSVVLYVRIYKYYDTSIAKYVIIGSLIGDLFITPIQYFMSMGVESIRFPFFSLSYLMESVFFFLALSKRQRVMKDQNINLEQSLFLSRNAALRAQMNPHFFNNVLNAINKFILNHENETASYYLTKFSRLMRDILNQSRSDVIDLKSEVETLTKYIEMETLRFNKQFEYQIKTDPIIDLQKVFIPPMLLQPFVENAINHGLLKKKGIRLLIVRISQIEDFVEIVVEDNGVGFNVHLLSAYKSDNNPHGISIVKERIQHNNSGNVIELLPIQSSSSGTKVVLRLH